MRDEPGTLRVQLPVYLAGDGDWIAGDIPMNVDLVQVAGEQRHDAAGLSVARRMLDPDRRQEAEG